MKNLSFKYLVFIINPHRQGCRLFSPFHTFFATLCDKSIIQNTLNLYALPAPPISATSLPFFSKSRPPRPWFLHRSWPPWKVRCRGCAPVFYLVFLSVSLLYVQGQQFFSFFCCSVLFISEVRGGEDLQEELDPVLLLVLLCWFLYGCLQRRVLPRRACLLSSVGPLWASMLAALFLLSFWFHFSFYPYFCTKLI